MNEQTALRPFSDPAQLGAPPSMTIPNEDFDANLRVLFSALYRNRVPIIIILVLTVIAGVVATMLTTPIYKADASIQIEQQSARVLSAESEDLQPSQSAAEGDRFLQTQVDVLKSRALAIQVVNSLNLLKNDDFFTRMGEIPQTDPIGELSLADSRRERTIRTLLAQLSVTLPRNSRVVQVSFSSPDPALAAQIANSFVTNYIAMNLKRKFDTSAYARDFLQQQLRDAKARLEDSERAMVAYARDQRLIDASTGISGNGDTSSSGPRSLTTSNLVQINSAYSRAQAQRIDAQQRYSQAMATPVLSLPEVLSNPAIQALSQQRAVAQADYDRERERHKVDYPSTQQAAAQIRSLDTQIMRIAQSIRGAIRDQYLTALKQEQALQGSVSGLKRDTLSEQDRSIRYNILKRETDTNRTMYDGLLQRYKEVSAAAGITANNLSVIDTAEVPPKPVSPRPLVNIALSIVAGSVLALLFVIAREKFDDVIRSPDDVQRKLGVPFLNSVPLLKSGETPAEVLADPRSSISESYAALRAALELVSATGLPKTLLFTSSRQSEGKSTSALAVARDFARTGKRVLLIDADLRKPSLHRTIGTENNNGFVSILARQRRFDEVVQHTEDNGLDFLSCGPLPPNPAQLLSGGGTSLLLQELQSRYDLIIVDGPPVLGLADAVLLANSVEGTVFVVEANGSHRGHAKAAIRRLQSTGAAMIGAVLTKFDARKVGYGDYYGYYYSYGEGPPKAA